MVSSEALGAALLKAGVNNLRPAARVYLANRLTRQAAEGGMSERNLGGLRNLTFGAAKSTDRFASFENLDAAAAALVRVADRAAPRAWAEPSPDIGEVPEPMGPPGRVPVPRASGGIEYVSHEEAVRRGATRYADGSWNLSTMSLREPVGDVSDAVASLIQFGPSKEANRAFVELVADWEGFERLGVGDRIFGPGDPRGNLRDDVVEWRKFRDEWGNGTIPDPDIAARLNVQRSNANKVRKYLAEAKVIDPALADPKYDKRTGVDPESATPGLVAATSVDKWAKERPLVNWLTDPSGHTSLPVVGPVPTKTLLIAGGAGLAALLLYLYTRGAKTVVVVNESAKAAAPPAPAHPYRSAGNTESR